MNLRTSTVILVTALVAASAPGARGQHPLFTLNGSTPGQAYGGWVEGVGDVSGDGTEDFLVTGMMSAEVRSGVDATLLFTIPANPSPFGTVRAAGDVNRNGTPDLITGFLDFNTAELKFQVYDGSGSLIHEILGPPLPPILPTLEVSQDGIGDIDQDGHDDFIVGVPSASGTRGQAFVYSGLSASLLYSYTGANRDDLLGLRVSGVGDLDQDGRPDFSISTPGHDDPGAGLLDHGRVQFFSGADGLLLWERAGQASGEFLLGAEGIGDVNGDGNGDVAISSPGYNGAFAGSGILYVAFGPDGTAGYSIEGSHAFEAFGQLNYCSAGDLDGDRLPDLLVGSIFNTANGPCAGRASTYRGFDGQPFHEYFGQGCDQLGSVGAFDQNGDGIGDLLIGAHGASNLAGTMQVIQSCPARWRTYGAGFAGARGIPTLAVPSDPVLGAPLTLDIGNSAGGTTMTLLLMGLARSSVQLPTGATLLVDPQWVFPLVVPAGGMSLPGFIENDPAMHCGFALDLQILQMDAAAAGGWSFSRGLELLPGYAYP